MPLNLPPSLSLFKPSEPNAQRFLPPIERTVTQILAYLRSSFDDAANGSMRILKPLILKTLSIDTDLTVGGTATAANVTVNKTLTTYDRAQIRAGLDTPTGIKTMLGQFGYSGNTTAGTYYNLGTAYYNQNVNMVMQYRGSVVGANISLYTATAMTVQTFVTGMSGGESRFDVNCAASTYIHTGYQLARGVYTFNAGDYILCKLYSPVAATGVSCVITPIIEYAT